MAEKGLSNVLPGNSAGFFDADGQKRQAGRLGEEVNADVIDLLSELLLRTRRRRKS
jgi:hypothetical protein